MAINVAEAKVLVTAETAGEERLRRLRQELDELTKATGQNNAASNAGAKSDAIRRQSMIQLGQQIGDVGVQLQMGTSAARVFAMQSGQVGFALAGMGGQLGKVGSFLAGPWGAALTIAISTLGMMAEELLNAETAAKKLETAETGLASAQGALGEMFDVATGKIKKNTLEVRLNTLAKIENMRAEAAKARADANSTFADAGEDSWSKFGSRLMAGVKFGASIYSGNDNTARSSAREIKATNTTAVRAQEIQRLFATGRASTDPKSANFVDKLFAEATRLNFKDINTDKQTYLQSLLQFTQANSYDQAVRDAETGMANNRLPGSLVTPKERKGRKGPKAPTAEDIADAYATALNSATQDEIKARRALTNSLEDRYQAEREAIASDMEQKRKDLANNKKLSDSQKEVVSFHLMVEQLEREKLARLKKEDEQSAAKAYADEAALRARAQEQGLMLDLAETAKDRRAIQMELLRIETEQRRIELNKIIKSNLNVSPEQRQAAQNELGKLDAVTQLRASVINDQNKSPIERYADEMTDTATKLQEAWVGALRSTEDALVNFATTGKLAFKDLANSIIADLIRIALRKSVVGTLTNVLSGVFGGGMPSFSKASAGVSAALGPSSFFGPGFANGGAFVDGIQKFAAGGVVSTPTLFPMASGAGLMGEAGPEAIMPLKRLSNGKLGVQSEGGGTQNVVVNVNVEGGDTKTSGDQGKAAQLGNLIAGVVRQELIAQKRPGGILAAA